MTLNLNELHVDTVDLGPDSLSASEDTSGPDCIVYVSDCVSCPPEQQP